MPDKFRPAIKKGVEAWQPAFEKAGFKNAILAKDAPTPREDPDWDAEDARYSSIRWLPSTIENAMGPHVHDPRTGEILESDIIVWHNVLKLVRDWYFVQASPNDPKAQQLPLPDDLIGELLTYVVVARGRPHAGLPAQHEGQLVVHRRAAPRPEVHRGERHRGVDHGLRPVQLRRPARRRREAHPQDRPLRHVRRRVGLQGSSRTPTTYEQEKAKLDEIVARQLKDRTLLFGDPDRRDPSAQTEDLGDDAVAATELGLKNIDRVAGYLVKATARKGEDYEQLQNMYVQLVGQRNRELMHVVDLVGGSVQTNFFYGDGDKPYDAVAGRAAEEGRRVPARQRPSTRPSP